MVSYRQHTKHLRIEKKKVKEFLEQMNYYRLLNQEFVPPTNVVKKRRTYAIKVFGTGRLFSFIIIIIIIIIRASSLLRLHCHTQTHHTR